MDLRHSVWHFSRSDINFILLNVIVIIVGLCLYVTNQRLVKPNICCFITDGYFNDALGMSILIAYSNSLITLCCQRSLLICGFCRIIIFTILVGLFWEYLTPLYRADSASDPFDILAYLIGAIVYYLICGSDQNPL